MKKIPLPVLLLSVIVLTSIVVYSADAAGIPKKAISLAARFVESDLPTTTVFTDTANTFGAFDQIFQALNLKIVDNTDATKIVTFDNSGMTTAKTLTIQPLSTTTQTLQIPSITATDTLDTLGLAQTITGIKTMSGQNVIEHANTGLTIRNPANTFDYTLAGGAITAARTLTLPVITGGDTIDTLGLAQTITGIKTMTGQNVILLASNGLTIRGSGGGASYTLAGGNIAANRILNLPLTTATDTLGALGMTQTWTGTNTFTAPILTTGTAVTVTSCTGGVVGTGSNNVAGRITGLSTTTCTITFAGTAGQTYTNIPFCTVTDETTAVAIKAVPSTTTLAVTLGATPTADTIDYICVGR